MGDEQTVKALSAIISALGLSYNTVAPLIGVSPSTVRFALGKGVMPKQRRPREAIERFVAANAKVRKREELRFTAV